MRKQPLFQPGQEHDVELQALGRVHRHQLHRVGALVGLVVAGFQGSVGEEVGQQRVRRRERLVTAHRPGLRLGEEVGRGVDQFVEVLQPIAAFLVGLVVRAQAAEIEHVVDQLGERQAGGVAAQVLHQADKLPKRATRLAGEVRHGGVQAGVVRARGVSQHLERARTDAAGGEVHHARERRVVVRVGDQAQIGERVLDLLALEEAQAAIHAIRDAGRKELMLQHPRLRVRAVQQRDLGA